VAQLVDPAEAFLDLDQAEDDGNGLYFIIFSNNSRN